MSLRSLVDDVDSNSVVFAFVQTYHAFFVVV